MVFPPGSVNEVDMSMVSEKLEEVSETLWKMRLKSLTFKSRNCCIRELQNGIGQLTPTINLPVHNEMSLFKDSQ